MNISSVWGSIGANVPTRELFIVNLLTDLRALTTPAGDVTVLITGRVAINDGLGAHYYWNAADASADNGTTIIQPNDLPAVGRWNKLTLI